MIPAKRNVWFLALSTLIGLGTALGMVGIPDKLSPLEKQCVGTWTYMDPGEPTTRIVYQFDKNREAHSRKYYLTGANPTVPRIVMRGRWRVESDGQLIVERRRGLYHAADALSAKIGTVLNNTRDEVWRRPMLTRFYWIDSATKESLFVHDHYNGKQISFEMKSLATVEDPFRYKPAEK